MLPVHVRPLSAQSRHTFRARALVAIRCGPMAHTLLVRVGAVALHIPTLVEAVVHGILATGAVVVLHTQTAVEGAPRVQKEAVEGLLRALVEAGEEVVERTSPRLAPRKHMLSSLSQESAGSGNVIGLSYLLYSSR